MPENQMENRLSIAVLPFNNHSADSSKEYLSDGIAETIINTLSKVQGLKVIARTSAFAFKGQHLSIQQIGQQLEVSAILEGSIQAVGNEIRINTQLVNAEDGFHFWSTSFRGLLVDLFNLQDEVSLAIAEQLREHLGHFEIEDQNLLSTKISVSTYQLFLKARFLVRQLDKSNGEEALSILQQIIDEEPDFPLAYLEIHSIYTFFGAIGVLPRTIAFTKGHHYLERALALAPNLPECLYQLAQVQLWQNWDLKQCCQLLAKAIHQRPAYADAYQLMGLALIIQQDFKAASHYQDIAMQLNPFDATIHYHKGVFYYFQKQYKSALQYFTKSLALHPTFLFSRIMAAASYVLQNQLDQAWEMIERLPKSSEADLSKIFISSIAHATQGHTDQLLAGIRQLEAALDRSDSERASIFLIYLHSYAGNNEKAVDWVAKAIEQKLPMLLLVRLDPLLQSLHRHPRFQSLLSISDTWQVPRKKYKKPLLQEDEIHVHQQQLQQLMRSQQPYLDANLTLRQLANMLSLHPNLLSQLLNQGFKQNFSEFINSYRLEAFKTKAKSTANQHLTILATAFECGFNSKTVFNTFFKKKMGKTPRQYWKEMLQQGK